MANLTQLTQQHQLYQQDNQFADYIKDIKSKSVLQQQEIIKQLPETALQTLIQHPAFSCHYKQIITSQARYIIVRSGRRWGKSEAGGAWMARKIKVGATRLGLCGETYSKVEQIMIPTIVRHFGGLTKKGINWDYNHKDHILTLKDYPELIVYCWSSDCENRGHGIEYLWEDEVGSWCDKIPEKVDYTHNTLNYTVSESLLPQSLITTTAENFPLFFRWEKEIANNNPSYHLITGNMEDNPFLSEEYKKQQREEALQHGDRGRQEYYGELIYQSADALFKKQWIDDHRITDPTNTKQDQPADLRYFFQTLNPNIKRIRISIDPAVSNGKTSDQTGIVVLAQSFANDIYILHDKTAKHSPADWALITRTLFRHYHQFFPDTRIVAEVNQGGDLVKSNLVAADHYLESYIDTIHASKGKLLRAEPIAAKYQRGKVHHIGYFPQLERQMCNYTGDSKMGSPDSMDAMVHGVSALTIVPSYTNRELSPIMGW